MNLGRHAFCYAEMPDTVYVPAVPPIPYSQQRERFKEVEVSITYFCYQVHQHYIQNLLTASNLEKVEGRKYMSV